MLNSKMPVRGNVSSLAVAVSAAACAVAGVLLSASPARADWNPGEPHKMHYPQLPDLTPTGIDVLATRQAPALGNLFKLLADDWRCSESGPVSDIHIWGSWLDDRLPTTPTGEPNPHAVGFKLSIHADIPDPDGPTGPGYSQPGAQLWSRVFPPGSFVARPYSQLPAGSAELFWDPNVNQVMGTDTVVWQYNFDPIDAPFIQEFGKIYWLDVQALPQSEAYFGWKTTNPQVTPHFNDDAVFGDTETFDGDLLVPPGWRELVYPTNHPFGGQSIDLAFVITPEPGSALLALGGVMGMTLFRRRR